MEKNREISQHITTQTYMNIAGVMIVALDRKGNVSMINQKGCKILGYAEKDILGKNWFKEFLPEHLRNRVQKVFKQIISGEVASVEYYENTVVARGGLEKCIAWHNAIIHDENGNIIGTLSSGEDISDRKKAEEQRDHLNNILLAHKNVDQLITREKDPKHLIQKICKALIKTQGYTSAWIVLTDKQGHYKTSASSGLGQARSKFVQSMKENTWCYCVQMAKALSLTVHMDKPDELCGGCALLGIEPYGQAMTTPLMHNQRVLGYLSVAIPRSIEIGEIDKELISEIAEDITIAFISIEKEEKHRIDEQRFRDLFEYSNDAVFIHDIHGHILDANGRACEMVGLDKEELLLKKISDIHPADERQTSEAAFRQLKKTAFVRFESKLINAQKKIIDVEISSRMVDQKNGIIQGIVRDITESKHAQKALRENEEKFRNLFDNAPLSYQSLDRQGNILDVNETWLKTLGYKRDEVMCKQFKDFLASPSADQFKKRFSRLKKEGYVCDQIYHLQKKDGSVMIASFVGNVGYDHDGQFARTHCIFHDITEQIEAEKKLQESEEQLKEAQQIAHLGSWNWDIIQNEEIWSLETYCIFDVSPEDFTPNYENFISLIYPDDRQSVVDAINAALEADKPVNVNYRIKHSDASERIVNSQGKVFRNKKGDPVRMSGTCQDITERKKTEDEIRERLQFEILMTELSTGFISLETVHIDAVIEKTFEKIGAYFDIDRIVLWELSNDKKQYHISHSWSVDRTEPVKATLSTDSFPYISYKLLTQGDPFLFSSVEEIPKDAFAERHYYDQLGIKSSMVIPLLVAGSIIGGLSFSTMHINRDWPVEIIQRLSLIGEILSNALIRKRAEEDLRESESRLSSFINSALDSFYLLDSDLNFVEINRRGLEIIGKPKEVVIGKNITEIVPYIEESGRYEKHLQVMRTGEPFIIEDFIPHPVFGDLHFLLKSFKVGDGLGVIASDITEHKKAENALHESEERYRWLVESAPIAVFVFKEGQYIFSNPFGAKMLGYSDPEKAIGKDVLDSIAPEYHEKILERISKTKEGVQNPPMIIELLTPDKQRVWVETLSLPIILNDEEVVLVIGNDISARITAVENLRVSQERLKKAEQMAHLGSWEFDVKTQEYFWSDEFYRICGYEPKEFFPTMENAYKILHPNDRIVIERELQNLIESGEGTFDLESRIIRPDHSVRHVHSVGELLVDSFGKPYKLIGSFHDITERKIAEQAIIAEKERAQTYLDVAGVMFIALNADGEVILSNQKASEILGYPEERIIGKNWFDTFIPGKDNNEIKLIFKDIISGDIERNEYVENYILTREKKKKLIAWHNITLRNSAGEITGTLSSGEDITVRKRAEERIRKNLEEKEVLLQEIHHRVKNNLAIINSLLSLQSMQLTNKEQAVRAFKESVNRIHSMALVHEILYQSKDFAQIHFREYIQRLVGELLQVFEIQDRIDMELKLENVYLDLNRAIPCGLILNELITNAAKYAFPEQREGRISITFATLKSGEYSLTVKDNGIGVPEDFNIDHTDSLGLHLVKILAGQIDGKLLVSRVNGTKINIKFPIKLE
ncbi:PAS domain S-box protein [bacterium]